MYLVNWIHVQQVEFELIRHQRLRHAAVERIELRGAEIGNTRAPDFSGPEQLVQSPRSVVDAGEPVGAMDKGKLDVVRADQAE